MKEAAGEANMTVITIVLIAIVLGVGTIIVTSVMKNTGKSTACQTAGGIWSGGVCYTDNSKKATLTCKKAKGTNGYEEGEWYCRMPAESTSE